VETLGVPRPSRRQVRHDERVPVVSNARLAMIILIGAESMFFAGLIGAYLVFRLSAHDWPPPDLPRLPLGVTTINSLLLFASVIPMTQALRTVHRVDRLGVVRGVTATTVFGTLFLAIQGAEWLRLVRHGLTLASGTYGATFYVLIGCHALHVLIAVGWLAVVAVLARRRVFTPLHFAGLEMCAIYWYFVCALWLVLFPLVYVL
jgi:heme/copper-type cytochrome/quinol oxidase subunit 3